MRSVKVFRIFLMSFAILAPFAIMAQVPYELNFQGRMTDDLGAPIEGMMSVTFRIYDSETDGTELWSETQAVEFTQGLFNVILGEESPLETGVFNGEKRWLQIEMGTEIIGPRKPLITVPYSYKSNYTDSADWAAHVEWDSISGVPSDIGGGVSSLNSETGDLIIEGGTDIDVSTASETITISFSGTLGDEDWQIDGDDMYAMNEGNVGIGIITPDASSRLHIVSDEGAGSRAVLGEYTETGPQGWLGSELYGAYGQFDGDNYGALGSSGIGIYACGETHAAYLEGEAEVTGGITVGTDISVSATSSLIIDGDAGSDDVLLSDASGNLYWGTASLDGDDWGSQVAATDLTLAGDGSSASPLSIAQQGATSGQVLKWNGSTWTPDDDETGSATTDADWTIDGTDMYSIPSGNVGIGTTTPTAKLDIADNLRLFNDSRAPYIEFAYSGRPTFYLLSQAGPNGFQIWRDWSSCDFAIDDDGEIGIGTTDPTNDLDIDGTIRIRGGAPDDGKVLTSDIDGNATWQTPTGGGADEDWNFITGSTISDPIYRTGDLAIGVDDTRGHLVNAEIPVMSSPYLDHAAIHGAMTTSADGTVYAEGALAQKNTLTTDGYPITADYIGVMGVIPASGGAGATNMAVYAWNENDNSLGENYGVYSVANGTEGEYNYGLYANASGAAFNYGIYAVAPDGTMDRAGYFDGDVEITGALFDNTGTSGTSGNVLTSTGDGFIWSSPSGGSADEDWTIDEADGEIYNLNDDVGIGTMSGDIDPSAIFEVESDEKGVLFPRMNTEDRNAITSPADGLLIFNTDTKCFNYYIDSEWLAICGKVASDNKYVYRWNGGSAHRFENTTGSYMTVIVKAWGGGGGGNGNDEREQGFGGGSGFVQASVSLAAGEYLDIEPAEGGSPGAGAGASIITHSTDGIIMVAAGGGGAGACGGSPGPDPSHGGAGGGFFGEDGDDQHTTGTYDFEVYGGKGGTDVSGGLGGTAWTDRTGVSMCDGDDGAYLAGGNTYSRSGCGTTYYGGNRDEAGTGCSNGCGGTGGAGYYGGGGAGAVYTYRGGGGGGGSSYFAGWPDTREPHFTVGGEGQIAGNMHDPDYQFSAGLGGYPGTRGKDGLVVIIID
ncbi:MAG: hypothetical protein ACLFSQ_10770 [Candidatus Zixiibacteriota bacterium]